MHEQTLGPCPFCGEGSTYRDPHRGGEWSHDVPGCFLNGVYIAGQHSIEQWNTRAAHSVMAGKVAELTDPAEMVVVAEAVAFYADPENWHGVYMVGSGPMADDWSEVGHPQYPDGKPGKRAREAIDAYLQHRAALAPHPKGME